MRPSGSLIYFPPPSVPPQEYNAARRRVTRQEEGDVVHRERSPRFIGWSLIPDGLRRRRNTGALLRIACPLFLALCTLAPVALAAPIQPVLPAEQQPVLSEESAPQLGIPTPESGTGPGSLKVHFIDVGHGDSCLIQTPRGHTILVDGGNAETAQGLVQYLKNAGVKRIAIAMAGALRSGDLDRFCLLLGESWEEKKRFSPRVTTPGIDRAVDESRRAVHVDGVPVELTAIEFDILALLAREPGVVVRRQAVLDDVWGPEVVADNHLIDVHIANLRRKLGDDPAQPRFIETIRGVGFRLRELS